MRLLRKLGATDAGEFAMVCRRPSLERYESDDAHCRLSARIWSGIATAVEIQAEALANAGAEAHVVVGQPSGIETASSAQAGCVFMRLAGSVFRSRSRGFDWVHLHSLALAELALEMRKRFRVRLAYTAHSVIARELPEGSASRILEQRATCRDARERCGDFLERKRTRGGARNRARSARRGRAWLPMGSGHSRCPARRTSPGGPNRFRRPIRAEQGHRTACRIDDDTGRVRRDFDLCWRAGTAIRSRKESCATFDSAIGQRVSVCRMARSGAFTRAVRARVAGASRRANTSRSAWLR